MNLQSERIADACRQLGLYALPEAWPSIAEHHIAQEGSYADFIEKLLAEELKAKTQRTKASLLKFAGLPNIKGESYRLKDKRKAGLISTSNATEEDTDINLNITEPVIPVENRTN